MGRWGVQGQESGGADGASAPGRNEFVVYDEGSYGLPPIGHTHSAASETSLHIQTNSHAQP